MLTVISNPTSTIYPYICSWQPASSTSGPVLDSTFAIENTADNSKILKFLNSNIPSGTTVQIKFS